MPEQLPIAAQVVLGVVDTEVHAVPHPRWLLVTKIVITNVTAGAVSYTLYWVPAAGAPGAGNAIVLGFSLAANTFAEIGKGLLLGPGGSIWGVAGAGNSINVLVCGFESGLIGG